MSDIKIEYATNLVDKAVLAFLANKTPRQSFSHWDIWHNEHAVSFTVAKMMSDDLLKDVQNALIRSIEQGKSFNTFKKEMKRHLMAKGWWGEQFMLDPKDPTGSPKLVQLGSTRRLKLIFETNIRQAQAYGQWQRIWKNRDFFPYLEYIESTSDSQREQHLEFVGLILPVEHPFWDKNFPPNGYNCKCSVLALTKKDAIAKKGEDGLKADLERANRLIEQEKEFENPRQEGRTVKHHRTVTPTFAYNAGKIDTVGLLDKIFQQKHGMDKWHEKLFLARERHIAWLYLLKLPKNKQITLPNIARNKINQALLPDPADGKENLAEAEIGTAYAMVTGKKLKRPARTNKPHPDFYEIDDKGEVVGNIDFMYVVGTREPPTKPDELAFYRNTIIQFNKHFRTAKGWKQQVKSIQEHLNKVDNIKIPVLLDFLDQQNRVKLLNYIATLPIEEQRKFEFVEWKEFAK